MQTKELPMSNLDKFSVSYGIGSHLHDCWPQIPRDQAKDFAMEIAENWDYTEIADAIDLQASAYCRENGISQE